MVITLNYKLYSNNNHNKNNDNKNNNNITITWFEVAEQMMGPVTCIGNDTYMLVGLTMIPILVKMMMMMGSRRPSYWDRGPGV